jgi:CxxC motif-containing protein (DUF1111 family)
MDKAVFQAGAGPFDFHWEIPQLGPLYNNDACFGCHGSNGRGRAQIGNDGAITDINGPQSESLVRVSLGDGTPSDPGGDVPLPGFGLQLHDHATVGLPQVHVEVSWSETPVTYGDGTVVMLRKPVLDIEQPDASPLPTGALTSYRTAPRLIGLGLLDAVDDATLQAFEDPDDADGDGISGRVNMVWNPETQAMQIGRFGWKANVATLRLQAAGAAFNDMGLTNALFPPTDGSDRDVSDTQLEQMTFMVSTVAVPAAAPRDAKAWTGRALFERFGCTGCHVPTLVTGDSDIPQLAHQTIHPYTDLLLHDMGDGLADDRPDCAATGSEWRTTPLWGLGLDQVVRDSVTYLHDGRARTFEEAILWHGGEAMAAREAFRTASAADRAALLAFLQTL